MCLFSNINWSTVGKGLSGFLTILIAMIALGIAWQQSIVNRREYRLALFEKRMAIFNRTMKFIRDTVNDEQRPYYSIVFLQDTRDHQFLFDADIDTYINELARKWGELHLHTLAGPDKAQQRTELLNWFAQQPNDVTKLFLKYLDFRKPY